MRNLVPVWIFVFLFSGILLMGQDCAAQTNLCDPDPCEGIANAVPDTCTVIPGGVCLPDDFACQCSEGYTWNPATHSCEGEAPPVTVTADLCQKNPGTWECVVGGASGTLTYQPTGSPDFDFSLSAQGLDPDTDYRLIYYVDTYSPWRPGKPKGMCLTDVLTPLVDGTLSASGAVETGDLPWPDDLNCPVGAKVWLIADADADCAGPRIMTAWNPASYLFDVSDDDWVQFDDLTQDPQPCNQAPVADAGEDQDVWLGETVLLDGSGSSDPEGSDLEYAWSFVSRPSGSEAVLANPTAVDPSFTADKEGAFVVRLVVYDGSKDSAPDTVTVTATVPTANLCQKETEYYQCIEGGATATLTYNTIGNPDFNFALTGQGLVASTNYTLIYYPDPWPGNGLLCLGSADSAGDGSFSLTGSATPGDLPWTCDDNCGTGAKIWLVPTGLVNCVARTITWSPAQFLFDDQESDWINFDDLSDDPGECVGGGC